MAVCRDEGYSRPLSEEELVERDRLLSENPFKDWMRRDFNAFLRACEKHGRQNIDAVAKEVESKTEEEVKAYAEVFFARYTELQDYEKYIKQIERGEQKIQRQQSIMKVGRPASASRNLYMISKRDHENSPEYSEFLYLCGNHCAPRSCCLSCSS